MDYNMRAWNLPQKRKVVEPAGYLNGGLSLGLVSNKD
jgi:hypothetical protein